MVGSIVCGILLDKTHKFWWAIRHYFTKFYSNVSF